MKVKIAVKVMASIALVLAARWFYLNGPGGTGVLAKLDLGGGREVCLTQEWMGWIDPNMYSVDLWYRVESNGLWGVETIAIDGSKRWWNPVVDYDPEENSVRVVDDWEGSWEFSLRNTTRAYGERGFLFDPEWQPGFAGLTPN